MTAEEKARARAAINESMKDESETTRKIGNAILGAATARITFETVSDIGDVAAWDIHTKELDVLAGETEFSIQVDISADNDQNKTVPRSWRNPFSPPVQASEPTSQFDPARATGLKNRNKSTITLAHNLQKKQMRRFEDIISQQGGTVFCDVGSIQELAEFFNTIG